ncbi:MAG: hypothetical protein PUE80_04660, partial [bacterium]|nr:hypothetical protein [bacterium]
FITGVSEGNANASHIEYTYRADGNPLQVMLGGMISTTFEYDDYGRQTAINDPSAGRRERTYDASGRIATETDARGKSVSYTYNKYGLPVSQTIDGVGTMEYAYDAHSNLTSMKENGNVMRTYSYDDYSRVTSMREGDFEKKMDYVGKNVTNVAYLLNNSQICAEQHLNTLGWLSAVNVNNVNVWRLIDENEKGLPTAIGCGALSQWLSYDSAGRVTGRKMRHTTQPFIQNVAYEYDYITGNMTQRCDSIYGHTEVFAYDSMNRLTAGGSDAYAYDTKGNVTYRDGVGSYSYTSARPYAVNHVPFSTMIPQREQHIAFNALQMPDSISEGGAIATFTYGADLQRSTMTLTKDGTTTTTRYYDGSLNTFTRTSGTGTAEKQVLYVGGDAYSAPAALVRDFGSADWQLRHIVRDNQGSIVAIADTAGNVLERNDYDPWGVLRNPLTQAPYAPADQPSLMLGRGYCGHEHLLEFGLINMNARLYDPALCRFLSPDPIVQAPTDPQNFNRYTYCLNNPLRYTDPSGMTVNYDDDERTKQLQEFIQELRRISKLFDKLYRYINESETNISIGFGDQIDPNNSGQFDAGNNRISFNEKKEIETRVVVEEFYHAFQELMKKLNQSLNWNQEFEAKMASILICAECDRPANFSFDPFDKVAAEIYINAIMYGVDYYTRDFGIFENLYMITAPSFLKAYRNMNTNHTYPILFVPNTIKILLFNEK